jgi:hypothetical protein
VYGVFIYVYSRTKGVIYEDKKIGAYCGFFSRHSLWCEVNQYISAAMLPIRHRRSSTAVAYQTRADIDPLPFMAISSVKALTSPL